MSRSLRTALTKGVIHNVEGLKTCLVYPDVRGGEVLFETNIVQTTHIYDTIRLITDPG